MPSMIAMTRWSVCDFIFVAQPAPNHAPSRLPASRLTTVTQFAAMRLKGTVAVRNGKADATTIRLMALFRMTASRAAKWKAPISNGKRNSAPPNPIKPLSAPIIAPPLNAAWAPRDTGFTAVGVGMASHTSTVRPRYPTKRGQRSQFEIARGP